jgi:hypothetical protein
MFRPSLRAMKVQIRGEGLPPTPVRIRELNPLDVSHPMNLVFLDAELLAATWPGENWRLQCRMGKQLIKAGAPPGWQPRRPSSGSRSTGA